jgi:acetyl-CoA C-acetyltransferase
MDDVGNRPRRHAIEHGAAPAQHPVTRVENLCADRHRSDARPRSTRWRRAPVTSRWRSASRSSRTPATAACPSRTVGTYIPTCGAPMRWRPGQLRAAGHRLPQPSTAWTRDLKRAISHVSMEEPRQRREEPEGALPARPITEEQALKAPIIAEPLGLYDCCGVSDGAAAAIVATRHRPRDGQARPGHLQGAAAGGVQRSKMHSNDWDGSYVHTTRIAAGGPMPKPASPTRASRSA